MAGSSPGHGESAREAQLARASIWANPASPVHTARMARILVVLLLALFGLARSSGAPPPEIAQDAYVWQRVWTQAGFIGAQTALPIWLRKNGGC